MNHINRIKGMDLSKSEKIREINFENKRSKLIEQGYKENCIAINRNHHGIITLVLTTLITMVSLFLFSLFNSLSDIWMSLSTNPFLFLFKIWGFIILSLILFNVELLISGIMIALSSKNHFKSVSFGFVLSHLSPICYIKEAVTKGQYIAAMMTPGILLSFLLIIAAIINGSLLLLLTGSMMIPTGHSNIRVALKVLAFHCDNKTTLLLDHPKESGVSVFYM